MSWITTGAVNLVNGSNVVTGVGSKFLQDGRIGDGFRGPNGMLYEVTNVPTNTSLTIQPAYEGATVNAAPYFLVPIEGYVKDSADQLRTATGQIALIPGGKQDKNANLTALSAAVAAINGVPYFTSLTVMGTFATTTFSRGLMNSADAATFRTAIALGNVNNTSDSLKPISTYTQAALDSKLSLGAGGVMSTNQNFEHADVVSSWQGNRWVGYSPGAVQGPPAGNATYGFHVGSADSRQFKMQIDFATGRPWYLAGTAAGIAANAWKRGFLAGDCGIGGRSSESLPDFNVTRDSGIYGVNSGTLNPPVGFLGGSLTLLMNYNDNDSFEFVSKRTLDGRVGWRRKVSGTYGPWIYPLLPGDGGLLMPPGSNLPWPSGNLDSIVGAVNGGEYATVGGTTNIPLGFNPCTISYAIRVVDAASEAGTGIIQCTQTIKNLLGQVAVRSANGSGNQATPPWGSWNITATAGVNSNITSMTGLTSITSSLVMSLPTKLATFTVATLPSASLYSGCTIMVSNAAGGAKQCTSNSTVWQITNTTTTVS